MTDTDKRGPYQRAAERAGWDWDKGDDECGIKPVFYNNGMAVTVPQWVEPTEADWHELCVERGIPVVAREGEITEPGKSTQDAAREDIAKVAAENPVRGAQPSRDFFWGATFSLGCARIEIERLRDDDSVAVHFYESDRKPGNQVTVFASPTEIIARGVAIKTEDEE